MNEAQVKALAKVHKLLRLSKSDNEAEAMLAAQRAEEIMVKYEIEQAMLDRPEIEDEEIMDFGPKGDPLHEAGGRKREQWQSAIADPICKAHACQLYWTGDDLNIIGRPSDVGTVRYLYAWAMTEAIKLSIRKGAGCSVVWKRNYMVGFGEGLPAAFKKARESAEAEMRGEATNENALVLVNNAILVIKNKMSKTHEWQREHRPLYQGRGFSGRHEGAARAEGRRDGAAFNVGGKSKKLGSPRKEIKG